MRTLPLAVLVPFTLTACGDLVRGELGADRLGDLGAPETSGPDTSGPDTSGPEAADPETDDDIPVIEVSTIAACLAGGGELTIEWSVDNGHGAISNMASGAQGRVALAGEDGSIKYWALAGGEPSFEGVVDNFNPGGMYGAEVSVLADVLSLSYTDDNTLWVGRADGQVCILEEASFTPQLITSLADTEVHFAAALDADRALVASRTDFQTVHLVSRAVGRTDLGSYLWGVEGLAAGAGPEQKIAIGHWYGLPAIETWTFHDGEEPRAETWTAPEMVTGVALAAVAEDEHTTFVSGRYADATGFVRRVAVGENDGADQGFFAELDAAVTALLYDDEAGILLGLTDDERLLGWDTSTGEPVFEVEMPMQHISRGPVATQLVGSGAHGMLVVYGCRATR